MNGRSILLTGGTGSFGQAFVQTVLERYPAVERLAVYSRDELKQHEMAQYTWTERVINRLGEIKAMSGRDKIKAAIMALGFPLK